MKSLPPDSFCNSFEHRFDEHWSNQYNWHAELYLAPKALSSIVSWFKNKYIFCTV